MGGDCANRDAFNLHNNTMDRIFVIPVNGSSEVKLLTGAQRWKWQGLGPTPGLGHYSTPSNQ